MSVNHLEYVLGYPVISVSVPLKGQDWKWSVNLEGNVAIRHTGNAPKPPEAVEGSILGSAVFGGGEVVVQFFKGQPATSVYTMKAPIDSLEIDWPKDVKPAILERPDPATELPPDPSPERIATGPSEV